MITFSVFLPLGKRVRLDSILSSSLENISRNRIQDLIRQGFVSLNGTLPKKVGVLVDKGATIEINDLYFPPKSDESAIEGKKQDLQIIYEDEDLLIVNKDTGVVMHPGAGTKENTLIHGLIYHCGSNLSHLNGNRPGIVHRLDKDTSGVVAIAKSDFMHNSLVDQLAKRTMHKFYWAWIWGVPLSSQGIIDAPIKRHLVHRQKMCVDAMGKEARTGYRVIKSTGIASLVECKLLTGRTHQIRVHMLYSGYPVIGDKVYKRRMVMEGDFKICRQALHAHMLELWHPRKKEKMTFSAPLPSDLGTFSNRINLTPG